MKKIIKKYFIKIYDGNNLEQIKEIEVIYENLDIPTAKNYSSKIFK